MKITWEVSDGYVGKGRPQYTVILDDKLLNCDTVDEAIELIDQSVQEDFEQKIGWDFKSRASLRMEVEKLFETKVVKNENEG